MPMSVRIEVEAGPDGPLVRKTAETDHGRRRLRAEADRLERARHPGVVELVAAEDDTLVLAWAGTDTLATTRPPLPVAAGILAAVASTVADLHELGVVHGRLDPGHVVLGGDGRPRLCGLRGSGPDEAPATPADDVAALGRLIDHLLGTDTDLEPIPDRRWGRKRWTGYVRRSLLTLADQATDADPARRPTARTLAAAVADLVPDAHLAPPAAPASTPVPDPHPDPDPDPAPAPPPADPAPRELRSVDHEPPRGTDLLGRTAADADPPVAAESESPPEPAPADTPAVVTGPDVVPQLLGLRIEPGRSGPGAATRASVRPDRPQAAARSRAERRRRTGAGRVPVYAGLALLALIAAAGWVRPGAGVGDEPTTSGPGRTTSAPAPATTTTTTGIAPAPPVTLGSSQPPTVPCPSTAHPVVADLDGDGCPGPVSVAGNRITVEGATFELGTVGDAVAVGDWDCDGQATPGLVRPGSGEVFLFDRWSAGDDTLTVGPTSIVPGARSVSVAAAPDAGPCPGALVRLADGSTQPLAGGAP